MKEGNFMIKLDTIQKHNNLNSIFIIDTQPELHPESVIHHEYAVVRNDNEETLTTIVFQEGPRSIWSSVNGVVNSDLLEIVLDRLTSIQNTPFATENKEDALLYIKKALEALNKDVENRLKLSDGKFCEFHDF